MNIINYYVIQMKGDFNSSFKKNYKNNGKVINNLYRTSLICISDNKELFRILCQSFSLKDF